MRTTKTIKASSVLICLSIAAILTSAATSPAPSRPPGIDTTSWLPISDSAGLVIVRSPEPGKVAGRLYGKKDDRWVEIIVESTPTILR